MTKKPVLKRFVKGDDFKFKDSSFKTYGITDLKAPDSDMSNGEKTTIHTNKIEIYGDYRLRNKIIKLLNGVNNG